MKQWLAEIIAIGDELVSGQRLDTNSQWISQQLEHLGIPIGFHTTVGDDLERNEIVFRTAIERASIVICSGGLGPTADDLTRDVIASVAGVGLKRDAAVVEKIQQMFARRQRPMPPNNLCQADFPVGSTVVPNPEGTAPGIDLAIDHWGDGTRGSCRVFALPGVPAELKQMWAATVEPALRQLVGGQSKIEHFYLHCFGEGESQVETMLPDLIRRGRDPSTGITASAATITLRVSTSGRDSAECLVKMQPVINQIRDCLGDLVYGQNGQSLEDVVLELLQSRGVKISILDVGLLGDVATSIRAAEADRSMQDSVLLQTSSMSNQEFESLVDQLHGDGGSADAARVAIENRQKQQMDFCIVIGPIDRSEAAIENGESYFTVAIAGPSGTDVCEYRYSGHSAWRQQRAVKQVLNQLRLNEWFRL